MKMFPTSRSEIIENFMNFSKTELSSYSKKRNFDFGPPHNNVSKLSPYLRMRFISSGCFSGGIASRRNFKNCNW